MPRASRSHFGCSFGFVNFYVESGDQGWVTARAEKFMAMLERMVEKGQVKLPSCTHNAPPQVDGDDWKSGRAGEG